MEVSATGLALIRRFEGFSAQPYLCPAGLWTIGYGHVLRPQERVSLQNIEEAHALDLLRVDAQLAARAIARYIQVPLLQKEFDSLVSFTFNVGAAALQRSTLRRAINRGDDEEVPRQWMRWVWGGGRRLPGLVRRRAAELLVYQG